MQVLFIAEVLTGRAQIHVKTQLVEMKKRGGQIVFNLMILKNLIIILFYKITVTGFLVI